MTRPSTNSRNNYIGTGTTGPFPFTFPVFAVTDLRVVKRDTATGVETVLTFATHFTTTTVFPAVQGGSITLLTALAIGETLVIRRGPALTQLTSYRSQGRFFPEMHEDSFDRAVEIDQYLYDELGRSLRVPESLDPAAIDLAVTPETGKALVWQSTSQLGNSTVDTSGIALPGEGRTTLTTTAYLMNNRVVNVLDYMPVGFVIATDDAAPGIRAALAALPARGGRVIIPHGRYLIGSTIDMPAEAGDGRTIEIVGEGDAILHNVAAANNPTFRCITGTSSANAQRGFKYRNLVFTGEAGFPNKGIHWRFVLESVIEDCTFNCHGNGVYIDGGVFGLVFRNDQFWPVGRKHGSPTTATSWSAILFDTPVGGGEFAHTMSFEDIVIEAGGRGIELKAGYNAYAWRFGRLLCEGLTGGNGWALDLTELAASAIGPIYAEVNSSGVMGDVNDLMFRFHQCTRLTVLGGYGSGKIVLTSCNDISFYGTVCQNFNADATNNYINLYGLRHSVVGGAGAGYANSATNKLEFGIQGAGGASNRALYGKLLRGTGIDTGSGTNDDIHGTTAVDGGVVGDSIRWVDAAGAGTAPRLNYLQKSLASDGVFITGIAPYALAFIVTNAAEVAIYQLRQGSAPVEVSDPQAIFTPTKDTAASYNVYIEAGDFRIQNKTGGTRLVTVFLFAAT